MLTLAFLVTDLCMAAACWAQWRIAPNAFTSGIALIWVISAVSMLISTIQVFIGKPEYVPQSAQLLMTTTGATVFGFCLFAGIFAPMMRHH
jgi:hypothetical protein